MSYLDSPGITFSGDFQSDVSTVNNDVRHYDNQTFEKRFQEPPVEISKDVSIENGWWNPEGGATFNFVNCKIRGVFPGAEDPSGGKELIGLEISGSKDRAPGKMVDLDPQMQMTSELWAVKFRISAADGSLLLEGDVHPTGFRDLGKRQWPLNNDDETYIRNGQALGAQYTSVIENIIWSDKALQIPFLAELKEKTQGNRLSIGFAVFGFYYTHIDGRFSLGKVTGAIGPWKEGEPIRFTASRRLWRTANSYFSNANIAVENRTLSVDLGMSFPLADPLGNAFPQFKQLVLAVNTGSPIIGNNTLKNLDPASFEVLGTVSFEAGTSWLMATGGIWKISITDSQQALIADKQLLLLAKAGQDNLLVCRESAEGWYIRCDQNVVRIDPDADFTSDFYIYQWGRPVAGKQLSIAVGQPTSGGGTGSDTDPDQPKAEVPWINEPVNALKYVTGKGTDANGKISVTFSGSDPENPRVYLDGQIYIINYRIEGLSTDQTNLDKVFVHLRNGFEVPENPTWADISDTMIQYANLYPIMSKHVVDLSDPQAVYNKKELVLFAFTRDINDPLYMPVTRDLSANKVATIVKWLKNLPKDGFKTEKADFAPQVAFKSFIVQPEDDIPILAKRQDNITASDLKFSKSN